MIDLIYQNKSKNNKNFRIHRTDGNIDYSYAGIYGATPLYLITCDPFYPYSEDDVIKQIDLIIQSTILPEVRYQKAQKFRQAITMALENANQGVLFK